MPEAAARRQPQPVPMPSPDAVGYAGCEIVRRLVSGHLVVPLTGLSDSARDQAAGALLDLAIRAVLQRAELTVEKFVSGGAGITWAQGLGERRD